MCLSDSFLPSSTGVGTRRGIACILLLMFLMPIGGAIAQQRDLENDAADQVLTQREKADSATTQTMEGTVADAVPSEVEQRELGADEDPMAVSDAQRDVQREEESEGAPERTTGFDVYGSIRIRYREQGGANPDCRMAVRAWGSSRIGNSCRDPT